MSKKQNMIELYNCMAKLAEPIAITYNAATAMYGTDAEFAGENIAAISQAQKIVSKMAPSLGVIAAGIQVIDYNTYRENIIKNLGVGLQTFMTPNYLNTVEATTRWLGNTEKTLDTFARISESIGVSRGAVESIRASKFSDYITQMSQSILENISSVEMNGQMSDIVQSVLSSSYLYEKFIRTVDDAEISLAEFAEEICEQMDRSEEASSLQQEEAGFKHNEEIKEALLQQVNNPIGFQESVANWTEKKKKQYYIIWIVLCMFWSLFLEDTVKQYVCQPITERVIAKVREIPDKAGNIIGVLKDSVEATITGDEPYYYKVTFIDENGNECEGYVAKRNIKVVNSSNEFLEKENK